MNTQLVESIVQLIKSLTPEEQALIQAKLHFQEDWENENQKLQKLKAEVSQRRNNQPFDPALEDYIQITRKERNTQQDQLISECFGKS